MAAAFDDLQYQMIVVVCGSQMGKTETTFNIIGWRMDDNPTPCLYIGPTQKQVKSVSQDRVKKMFESTPDLWMKLEKGNRNSIYEKYVAGVRLGFAWAGSATELASHPAGLVLVDERDRMESDVAGEGDPVILAKARTKNYPNAKVGVFSTPTVEGASPIWQMFEDGTMFKWAWPCPHCEEFFVPELKLLKWPEKASKTEALDKAIVVCPHCGSEITNKYKQRMNQGGRYLPHKLDDTGEHVMLEAPERNSTASFWISGLASPWVSFGEVAQELVSAYESQDHERIQAVINTYGGEVFKMHGEAPEWKDVMRLARDYEEGQAPYGVQLITCGVDVQKYGLYYVVRGWGFNSESWLLESGFIPGETEFDNVWILLGRIITKEYTGRPISRVFIDSGYRPGDQFTRPENAVYLFSRRFPALAFPTKGHDIQDRPVKLSHIDVTLSGKTYKGGVKLWHIDTDYLKRWLYQRIHWPEGESGAFNLYKNISEDYCKQLVAEEMIIKASGKRLWRKKQRDNHYLDCETNALAAAMTLQIQALKPLEDKREKSKTTSEVSPKESNFVKRPEGSFFRR